MSDERTEAATPKRAGQARSKGQIPKSSDFNSAVMLTVACSLLGMFSAGISNKLSAIATYTFSHLNPEDINEKNIMGILIPYFTEMAYILLPIMLILMVAGIALQYAQVGTLFTTETIKPDLSRISPMTILNNFKKFVSLNSVIELGKSLLKTAIVGGVAYSVINSRKDDILILLGADVGKSLGTVSDVCYQMFMQICIILIILGIADLKYQHYNHHKSLKMTKQEVKDEAKSAEGDPAIKAKIKSIQMKFAMQRMMGNVPKANVIVKNPTHFAVAIQYDPEIAPVPKVIAKGVDYVAFKILEIGKNNNIIIIENKPLARTLYKLVPVDGLIPAELYVAVAEVLAYVYKLNNKGIK
ncbi:MAG: flagellar biosynthesis protein FlhB [bacterium]